MQRPNRSAYPQAMERLLDALAKLPGIGRRSAERIAFHLLKAETDEAAALAAALEDVRARVKHCSVCCNLADRDPCAICSDPDRTQTTVLVVEQPRDLIAIEQTGMYKGLYHCLLGRLSPLDGVGPGELTIDRLLERIGPSNGSSPESSSSESSSSESQASPSPDRPAITEVILGLSPTAEGDATMLYLGEVLNGQVLGSAGTRQGQKLSVSRLARGLPTGWSLEFANKAVLADALEGRRRID